MSVPAVGQQVAIRNNLLYDAAATPNIGLDILLSRQVTLQINAGFNPFPLSDDKPHKWRHLLVETDVRYWFCQAFARDFIGFNVAYSHFNIAQGAYPIGWMYPSVKDYRYQGDMVAIGASYGWMFQLHDNFGIELEIGVDGGYAWADRFDCETCGKQIDSPRRFFAVPKAGVNLVVLLGKHREIECKPCKQEKQIAKADDETITEQPIDTIPTEQPIDTIAPVEAPQEPDTVAAPIVIEKPIAAPVIPIVAGRSLLPMSEYVPYSQDQVLSRDSGALYIHFGLDRTNIVPAFMNNRATLDTIISLVAELMTNTMMDVKLIQIVGLASFEGDSAYNSRLAQQRAEALMTYIQERIEVADSVFVLGNGGEGWSEMRYQIEQSSMPEKQQLLTIIDTEKDPQERERKIRELNSGETYTKLRRTLMRLQRNSGYIKVYYQ